MFYISDWTAVTRKPPPIPWDLEATPLQIKTDSALGSNKLIKMWMYNNGGSNIADLIVKFSSPMQYYLWNCSKWTNLPVQPPVKVDKIWTITKTHTSLRITCNNVEVLNYKFADSSDSNCVPRWGGNVVGKIIFKKSDSASDFYRAGNGLDSYHFYSTAQHVPLM